MPDAFFLVCNGLRKLLADLLEPVGQDRHPQLDALTAPASPQPQNVLLPSPRHAVGRGERSGGNLPVVGLHHDGPGNVATSTPMGGMVFTVMAALADMELVIKPERIVESVSKRRPAGKDLGGRRRRFAENYMPDTGESAAPVARDLSMSCAALYRRNVKITPA